MTNRMTQAHAVANVLLIPGGLQRAILVEVGLMPILAVIAVIAALFMILIAIEEWTQPYWTEAYRQPFLGRSPSGKRSAVDDSPRHPEPPQP